MSRLSNTVREQMARALVKHRFNERGEALCRESVALFGVVYDAQYSLAVQKAMRALEKLRPKALERNNDFNCNVRGMRIKVGSQAFGKNGCNWEAEAAYRSILNSENKYQAISYSDGEIADRLAVFAEAQRAFLADLGPAYNKALGTLGQFSTGKKLAAEWPEAMPVIGNLIPEDDRTLPVIQLAAINTEFDLPPALAEAA